MPTRIATDNTGYRADEYEPRGEVQQAQNEQTLRRLLPLASAREGQPSVTFRDMLNPI
jgi:hypothetical protein